ncbi:MAG: ABC transporter permease [Legionellaceae bacterium]|nr:ABC transporter permease [Legionellaceae bacterium]
MNIKLQLNALSTHVHHEITRMFRISLQVFLPSMVTTLLYFLIFGAIIGKRIGPIEGISYSLYISPGLVMIAIITNSYTNVSTSLFSARFQRSVEELLISPMHNSIFLLGYVLGGIVRGIIVALLVLFVAAQFVELHFNQLPFTLLLIVLFSCLFSLAGFTNGMLAKTFDDVALVPTFLLSPLTYLGGVFYSINMLPSLWHKIAQFNPIFYMVDALRYAMVGQKSTLLLLPMLFICGLIVFLIWLNLRFLKRGVGIRE